MVQTAIDYLIDGKLNWHGSLSSLMTTLFVTIRNLSWNHGEAEKKNQALGGEEYVEPDWSDADWRAVLTLLNGDLDATLQLLSEAEREVLLMRYVEDMKPAEIAEVRRTAVQTVYNQLRAAKRALRESGRLDAYRNAA